GFRCRVRRGRFGGRLRILGRLRCPVGQQGAAQEGDRGPAGDEDAQPGRYVVEVEESGGGDVGAEGRGQRDEEPAPPGRFRRTRAQPPPGRHQQQVDGDRIGPRLPAVLSGGQRQVVQVGEGQRGGDQRLDEYGVHAEGQGTHGD